MQIFILTSNCHKAREMSQYFDDIGLKSTHLAFNYPFDISLDNFIHYYKDLDTALYHQLLNISCENLDYLFIQEQTSLINQHTKQPALMIEFEEVTHHSIIELTIYQAGLLKTQTFEASVHGFIFPQLKTTRPDVYNWDDIFVPAKTMKTYQDMKDRGIKNSARDLAFSHVTEALPFIFSFDKKINLNFNPSLAEEEVVSFEPFIYDLFQNNAYYQAAYNNEFFKPIIHHVLKSGLFVRRSANRQQKNYWLPGLNAGIPLTPKKDELHELTFMFHDIMHFLFPDLIVTDESVQSKHKYILSRMISEAFTLVLADMLFISLLKKNGVDYTFEKRKIYPLFQHIEFDITLDNIDKIKEVLLANTLFALLNSPKKWLQLLGKTNPIDNIQDTFNAYAQKYSRFFQEDYIWTHHNYEHIVKQATQNKMWFDKMNSVLPQHLMQAQDFCPEFSIDMTLTQQVKVIFNTMFHKLTTVLAQDSLIYEPAKDINKITKNISKPNKNIDKPNKSINEPVGDISFTHSVRSYMMGQLHIFYQYDTLYNDLFLNQILSILSKSSINHQDLHHMKKLYHAFIDKLVEDNFINAYPAKNYKNIYPMFKPFYVFYEKKENKTFQDTLLQIFNLT